MDEKQAVDALSALAHRGRLTVFRLLVRAGSDGLAAGVVSNQSGIAPSTLSTHLSLLSRAGLAKVRREGRSLIYSADYAGMRELLGFLVADCCAGRPEICKGIGDVLCEP